MSCKQLIFLSTLALLLLSASVVLASSSEVVPDQTQEENVAKSYFGYQPHPKDSYKKLILELLEFGGLYQNEMDRLTEKIKTLYKRVVYRKDKDYEGYGYGDLQQIQKILNQHKAALDSLRNDRSTV